MPMPGAESATLVAAKKPTKRILNPAPRKKKTAAALSTIIEVPTAMPVASAVPEPATVPVASAVPALKKTTVRKTKQTVKI